jgi:hypothetical protein
MPKKHEYGIHLSFAKFMGMVNKDVKPIGHVSKWYFVKINFEIKYFFHLTI